MGYIILIIMLFLVAVVIASPIIYIIRIVTNLELSRKRILQWAEKNNYKVSGLKVVNRSLPFDNFGQYIKKQFKASLEIDRAEPVEVLLTCRLSPHDHNYETIVFKEI